MKKLISYIVVVCMTMTLLSAFAYAQDGDDQDVKDVTEETVPEQDDDQQQKQVVSDTIYADDIYRFIELDQKPDLSGGYIDFVFDDDTQQRVYLDDEDMEPFPDTSEPGRLLYTFEIYGKTYTLDFIVVDSDVDMSVFTDVSKSYWGYKKIRDVVSAGFFSGMSETEFEPRSNMTRAQFCQMIYNIFRDDPQVMTSDIQISFTDVESGKWYYEAVMACAEAGIVDGVGEGKFNPQVEIKRQEAAVMMMRILMDPQELEAVDVDAVVSAARENGIAAGDFDTTSDYAKKAVAASLGVIFFGDDDGNLTPKNNIIRAECASMIYNYFFDGYESPDVKYLVYLSPSNQMTNPYTGVDTNEGEQMQLVAAYVENRLKEMGYDVYTADVNTSIKEDAEFNRADEAAQLGADAYVAIHSNAVGFTNDGKYQGTTCYYNGNNKGAKELSQFIYDRLSQFTPTEDNGIHDDMYESQINGQKPYAEVRLPTMANLILEVEFHDYPTYAEWIVNNINGIGEQIALGIDDYLKSL